MLDLILIPVYGALGAGMFYYVIKGWRSLVPWLAPLRRRDYVVIGGLIALAMAAGKLLQ